MQDQIEQEQAPAENPADRAATDVVAAAECLEEAAVGCEAFGRPDVAERMREHRDELRRLAEEMRAAGARIGGLDG